MIIRNMERKENYWILNWKEFYLISFAFLFFVISIVLGVFGTIQYFNSLHVDEVLEEDEILQFNNLNVRTQLSILGQGVSSNLNFNNSSLEKYLLVRDQADVGLLVNRGYQVNPREYASAPDGSAIVSDSGDALAVRDIGRTNLVPNVFETVATFGGVQGLSLCNFFFNK